MCFVSAVELTQPACAGWIGIPLTEAIWKGASWLCGLSVCSVPVSATELGTEHSNAPLLFVVNIPMEKAIPGSSSHQRLTDTDKEEEPENFLSLLRGYFSPCFYRCLR